MSLRYALLGLLAYEPASGYDLTKRFEHSLGRYAWQAKHTQIYPELNRMADEDLIEVAELGARGRRTYAITEAGTAELRNWLMHPPVNQVVRSEHVLRMFLVSALKPDDARTVLRGYAEESAQDLRDIAEIVDRINSSGDSGKALVPFNRLTTELGLRLNRAMQDWALWAIEELDAIEGAEQGTP